MPIKVQARSTGAKNVPVRVERPSWQQFIY